MIDEPASFFVEIVDDDPLEHAYLGGCESDSGCLVHDLGHTRSEVLQGVVGRGIDLTCALSQRGTWM